MSLNVLPTPISSFVANSLGLTRLPEHFSTVVFSFLGFHVIQRTSPYFFNRWSPEHYGKASARVKRGWAARACSMFHSVTVVLLAFRCLDLPELNNDKLWGTHLAEERMVAFSLGFLWDIMEETFLYFQDIGLVLHGFVVLCGIVLTFRPLFGYICVRFLLLEISTPFLNIHWFLDKTGRTGTTLQLVNGIALIVAYFFCRICYGTVAFYRFLLTLYEARAVVPPVLSFMYAVGTISLQVLNCVWIYKIVASARRRFSSQQYEAKAE